MKSPIDIGRRSPRSEAISVAVALCCVLLLTSRARGLVGAELATGDIVSSVLGIVGPHNSFCTATAVARNVLLSAAHCVQQGTNYKAQYKDTSGLRAYSDIVEWERQPQYRPITPTTGAIADLALLRLAGPLPANIGVAMLGLSRPPIWPGDRFTVIGGGIPFRGLHETGVNRVATLVATGPYTGLQIRLVSPSDKQATTGACFGDSGSPLFQTQVDGTKVIGVVSWASGPNKTKGCGGITGASPLSPYRQWIEESLSKLKSSPTNM